MGVHLPLLTTVRDHILAQISGWSLKQELKKIGRHRHDLDKTYHLGNIMHNSQICDKCLIQSSKVLTLPLKRDYQEDFNDTQRHISVFQVGISLLWVFKMYQDEPEATDLKVETHM